MSPPAGPRTIASLTALVLVTLALLQGCDSGPTGLDSRRFACVQSDECVSGFVCRAGECRPEGEPVDGPDGGIPDGGGTDGGPDSGVPDSGVPDSGVPDGGPVVRPTQLAFATAPRTVEAGRCSPQVVLETRGSDGRAAPVATATTVSLTTRHKDFIFFADAQCANTVTQVTVPTSGSRATFYFRGTSARVNQVDAEASGLGGASQDETIRPGPPSAVVLVTGAQTVQAGACSAPVTLEARDAFGNTTAFSTATSVALTVQPAGGLTFFSDPGCTVATASTSFPAGATRASFYFKGKTGSAFTLSAQPTGFSRVSQTETILPVVRTGTCTLAPGALSESCPLSSPQRDVSRTMLVYQATSDSPGPHSSIVRCALTNPSTVTCTRAGSAGVAYVGWQTAELASGLRVQHVDVACNGLSTLPVPIAPVDNPGNTFLLVSSEIDGVTLASDDFFTARLAAPDRVELRFGTPCASTWKGTVQVVELTGASVARGLTDAMAGPQLVVTGLPAVNPATTALLFTYRVAGVTQADICDRVLRGELTSSTSLTFSRSVGDPDCQDAIIESISWERINLGPRAQAQHVDVFLSDTLGSLQFPISAVDTTRTLVFSSSQALSGQSGGEGESWSDDVLGSMLGRHFLASPTLLEVQRDGLDGDSRWFSTVLQLEP